MRAATASELDLLHQVAKPLLAVLRDPSRSELSGACPIGLVVVQSSAINAGVARGTGTTRCTAFTLAVTEGMLRRLPIAMLRAVLAHELAHVHLGHLSRDGRGLFAAAFNRQQEAEADRFAADLLRRLEPSYPDACVALVYVLAVLAQPSGATTWLSSHPSPDGRVDSVMAACNAS
jgi:Zn-dependent protease with chaperone function